MSTQTSAAPSRSSRSPADLLRTLAVVGAIVVALLIVNYRAPEDPVKQVDPVPLAASVATAAPFPVLLPTQADWRATSVRWERTAESGGDPVWYTGGVFGSGSPFASVAQSEADTPAFIAEQTGDGAPAEAVTIAETQWQRYESAAGRSLVATWSGATVVVCGTGSWEEVERFASSLRPVGEGSGDAG